MTSINNLVRTQNYRRLAAQLEARNSRINELERQLATSEQTSVSAAEKATAFNILAESLGIINKVHELNAFSDPLGQDAEPFDAFFDNKLHQKVLKVKSISCAPVEGEENKLSITAELAAEEKIFNANGKQLCTFKTLNLGTATLGEGEYKYGDLKEFSAGIVAEYDDYFVDNFDGTSHSRSVEHPIGFSVNPGPALIKFPANGNPSLGDLDVNEIEAYVDSSSLFVGEGADDWRWFVMLQLPMRDEQHQENDKVLTLAPIPAALPSEEEEAPEP